MKLSYNNRWKTLINRKMKKGTLCQEAEISTSTMSKMKRTRFISYNFEDMWGIEL